MPPSRDAPAASRERPATRNRGLGKRVDKRCPRRIGRTPQRRTSTVKGIGRRLVQQLAACLARKGIRSLQIAVLTANGDARRFYEALGGQHVGQRLFDEDGVLLPEEVYAWPDITRLLEPPQGSRVR